jgi:peptidoglycan/xylan/chitin deacetylase (PgdA/CDA1 family)
MVTRINHSGGKKIWHNASIAAGTRQQAKVKKMFHGIRNKREFLARALGRLGILRLLEETIATKRPGLVILTYHRIADLSTDLFYDPVISATPDSFRAQVEWLHNRVRLLTLDELIDHVASGAPWREPVILLTFDDGYQDNFDLAAPILDERKVPATFFIPTAFLETPKLPWWDHVAYVIKQTRACRLILERDPNGGSPPLDIDLQATSRSTAIMTIVRAFLDETIADECWFLNQLTGRGMVEVDSEFLGRKLFMSWDHIQQLASSSTGFAIGSHAHSHRKLAGLDDESQHRELADSKQMLEARLGRPIKTLAYPYGWPGTYTLITKALAAQAGYLLAFSSQPGINRLTGFDRYEVKRLGVGAADSTALLRARSTLYTTFDRSFL